MIVSLYVPGTSLAGTATSSPVSCAPAPSPENGANPLLLNALLLPATTKLPESKSASPVATFSAATAVASVDPAAIVPRFSV